MIFGEKLTGKHFITERRWKTPQVEKLRYEKFTLYIDGIHKAINRIKLDVAPHLGVKGVHVFWVYKLLEYPDGLTAAEIAAVSMIDKSLVSREIAALKSDGYIAAEGQDGKKRSYNARFTLTEKGRDLAHRIVSEVVRVQSAADDGVFEEELLSFYNTLEKIHRNITSFAASGKSAGDVTS